VSVLRLDGVTKSFGGFMAVDHVSLQIAQGEMRGLIGSNGAGKSTLLHLIYGQLNATSGTILFDGSDVTRMAAPERARRGMGLVFQITSVFPGLTVEENLLLGALPKETRTRLGVDLDEVERMLELVDLGDVRRRHAAHLSHGQQQWLEIGMVLLAHPKLLLLDEPTSGMTRAESHRTAALLRDLRDARATDAMIVVEHNIEFIRLVSDRVTVMHRGAVLADGGIDEVQASPAVQDAYLGRLH